MLSTAEAQTFLEVVLTLLGGKAVLPQLHQFERAALDTKRAGSRRRWT